ncbi:MAG: putative DNA-binding protein [Clostridia bacterium]|nr:putative DNA-binding protein [Clostridia bacterium]
MPDKFEISVLIDNYGVLLTEKQRLIMEYYFNDDLSLAEIAENEGITRQGVLDIIKRCKQTLFEYEEKLQLIKKITVLKEKTNSIDQNIKSNEKVSELVEYIDNL